MLHTIKHTGANGLSSSVEVDVAHYYVNDDHVLTVDWPNIGGNCIEVKAVEIGKDWAIYRGTQAAWANIWNMVALGHVRSSCAIPGSVHDFWLGEWAKQFLAPA
jgi:hypothetical protein